jgi:hypothetical protein
MNLKNISTALSNDLGEIIKGKINRAIIPGESYIPVTGKVLTEEDILYGIEAVLDGWLTAGRFAEEFEREIARYLGSRFSLLVNSGSSANLLAFYTLTSPKLGERAIQPGDEIITVAAGFPTTINPMIQFGCIPVLLDIDIPTYNIKAEEIEAAITPKTKAIMIAHTLGNPFNLDIVVAIAKKYNLWLIEDDCDSLGATYRDKKTGTFGDLAGSNVVYLGDSAGVAGYFSDNMGGNEVSLATGTYAIDATGTSRLNSLAGNGVGVVAVDNDGILSWSAGAGSMDYTNVAMTNQTNTFTMNQEFEGNITNSVNTTRGIVICPSGTVIIGNISLASEVC